MREQLLAYLLNDLDPAERQSVEDALADDPALVEELDHLRSCLETSSKEAEPAATPPTKLASRTCSFVEHAIKRSRSFCISAPHVASLSESRDGCTSRRRWTYADLGAAICVLLALGALVMPALRENRDEARLLQCQANQFRVGTALTQFNERFRRLPQIKPDQNAGYFVVELYENGILTREELAELVVCPATILADQVASGHIRIYIPNREEYLAIDGAAGNVLRKLMAGDYAYNLGYRTPSGQIQQIQFEGSSHLPLLSDAPSMAGAGYQSTNHGGCGQYVLFQDLSCRFIRCYQAKSQQDHWYLNDDGQPAAGCRATDIVLAPSEATPVVDVSTK
ncbi:hypothetical protein [Bythopirellula polymerisocia]|uniref:Zinc-finger domain-containing protein n=1 Tax=Bythopirellula polymerisocia TaxID=2528003 RepID=A0A5C6D0S9_9BACT|nr:hypothetical protein [Bythopirellula polymerisocia]TWU30328.1 hypothetical protein Pla144_11140 [Bythopirellula polymerisocia]